MIENAPPREMRYRSNVEVHEGDLIHSAQGKAEYRVLAARRPKTVWHLTVVRVDGQPIPFGATIHPLYWYSSRKRR